MANFFESIKDMFEPFVDGEEKNPLHVGEVMNLWLLLTLFEEGLTVYQIGLNTTVDQQLQHALKNGEKESSYMANQLRTFLRKEGIPLPPASEDKPASETNSIPLGVKYTDEEIANLVSTKVAAEIALIGQTLGQSIRSDVGQFLLQILYGTLKFSSSMKKMMQERGWLKIPPYFYPPGSPVK